LTLPLPAGDANGGNREPATGRRDARRTSAAQWAARAEPLVWLLLLVPLAWLGYELYADRVRGDLVKAIEIRTGTWAIRFLAASLAVTPVRALTGWSWLVRYRRTLGLAAFLYATIHFGIYLRLDIELDLAEMGKSIVKRPYITVGFTAWLLLIPLALTSTKGSIRRLGGPRWNRLHRLVYVVAVLATTHYLWAVKKDTFWPIVYFAVFAALLGWRIVRRRARVAAAASPTVTS
jgi:methionine sulfoxide reductase heme-binding subunit